MLDIILSIMALAGFALFAGLLGWWVKEPDLIAVLTIGVVGAAYDFWRSFRSSRNSRN